MSVKTPDAISSSPDRIINQSKSLWQSFKWEKGTLMLIRLHPKNIGQILKQNELLKLHMKNIPLSFIK